ncbi:MAG: hypothetical protein NW200_04400 [Hyphomonadaceae bacterium]|nr:hypothetical protein [Hyphomonadaceae bacterium]
MIELKAKLWRGVGLAVAVAAAGLAACSPGGEGGEGGGEAGEGAAVTGEAGETAGGESGGEGGGEAGGEGGEAGAAAAYAGLAPALRTQVRLQHLKGFLLVAQKEIEAGNLPEAGALVGQGVLEVHAPAPSDFGGLDIASANAASAALFDAKPEGRAALTRAIADITARQDAGDVEVVRRMLSIAGGLYALVLVDGGVDPIEYQHSLGAALAARDAFTRVEPALRARNAVRAQEARDQIDRLVALWPSTQAPETPAPTAQVAAQISRIELALSGL